MCLLDVFGVAGVHMVSGSVDHSWRLTDTLKWNVGLMRSVEQRRGDKRETRQTETRERGQGPDAGPSYQRSQEARCHCLHIHWLGNGSFCWRDKLQNLGSCIFRHHRCASDETAGLKGRLTCFSQILAYRMKAIPECIATGSVNKSKMVDKAICQYWLNIAQCKLNHYLCVQHIFYAYWSIAMQYVQLKSVVLYKQCCLCWAFQNSYFWGSCCLYRQKICIKQADFKDLPDLSHFILFHTLIKNAFSFR